MQIRVVETDNALSPRHFLHTVQILDFREFLQITDETVKVLFLEIEFHGVVFASHVLRVNHGLPLLHLLKRISAFKLHILTEVQRNPVANDFLVKLNGFLHVGNRKQRTFEFHHNVRF